MSDKLIPVWEDLPQLRRGAAGWSLIKGNEFTTWQTIAWNAVLHGLLYDASGGSTPVPSPPAPPILLD